MEAATEAVLHYFRSALFRVSCHISWIRAYLPTHEKLHDMVFVFPLRFLFAIVLFGFRAGRHLPLNCCPSPQSGRSRLVQRLHAPALTRRWTHPSNQNNGRAQQRWHPAGSHYKKHPSRSARSVSLLPAKTGRFIFSMKSEIGGGGGVPKPGPKHNAREDHRRRKRPVIWMFLF